MSFRENLGQSESSGNYAAKNSEGYTGKYQFGAARLADFMKANGQQFSMAEFQSNTRLQEEVQAWHEGDILDFVSSSGLDKYFGKSVGGVSITPGSVLGMAHLGGKTGMKKFIESGGSYDPADSNGTRDATPLGNVAVPRGFGASSKTSPLSRRGLPGAGAIDQYSTPGGIDGLYKR